MRFCWAFYAVAAAFPLAAMACGDSEEGTYTPPAAPRPCTGATFVTPADGEILDEGADVDGDCTNGLQLDVVVATNANDGSDAILRVNGRREDPTLSYGVTVRFENVELPPEGTHELEVDIGGDAGCHATATVITACERPPSCEIVAPVTGPAHPELNNQPFPIGDRKSDLEEPYRVEFRVLTSAEEGQVVTLNVDEGQSIAASTAVEGLAIFPLVALTDGQHTVSATCSAASGVTGTSDSVEYTVDTTAPGLVVADPEWGQLLEAKHAVNEERAAIQFRLCATTTSDDALDLPALLEAPRNNLCVYFDYDEAPIRCIPARSGGAGSYGDGACMVINCPGDDYFNLTATLTDDANNLNQYQVYGLRCDPSR